jgi:phosphate transport system substrate-binding protein
MVSLSSAKRAVLASVAIAVLAACGSSGSTSGGADVGKGALSGAGSSFDNPLFSKAFFDYSAQHSDVTVNYQPLGSGAGITQFVKKTVDFGASDVPMNDKDLSTNGGSGSVSDIAVQIPITLGVVAIAYNLNGVSTLNLDGDTLAKIYLGEITKWNDPAIVALNSGANLPSTKIQPVARADSSGTTYIFTDYLSKVSSDFQSKVGTNKKPTFPGNVITAQQTAGVAQAVSTTPGAIGYVELAYALQNNMPSAMLKNANGKFVAPTPDGATAAAQQVQNISATNFSIVNQAGDTTYPIAGFSWVILRPSYDDAEKGKAVVYLFKWLATDGQSEGTSLHYAPLPSSVQQLALNNLKTIKAGGSTVLS